MSAPSIASQLSLPVVTSFAGAQAYWWPCATASVPRVVLLYIPGNPGLCSYYTSFLHSIYTSQHLSSSSTSSSSYSSSSEASGGIEILCLSHRGHAPLPLVGENAIWGTNVTNAAQAAKGYGTSLQDQVRHKIAAFDTIRRMYPDKTRTKIVVAGHSIGAWMALEILKARPESVDSLHLLFPTLAWIGRTSNARKLAVLVHPVTLNAVLPIPLFFLSLLPLFLIVRLVSMITGQPGPAALSTAELLTTPGAVRNALRMAREEFRTLQGLDQKTIDTVRDFTTSSNNGDTKENGNEGVGDGGTGGGFVRTYWSSEESDSWAPGWIRNQVETQLGLQRAHLPPSLIPSAPHGRDRNGSVTRPSIGKARARTRSFSVSEYRSSPGSIPNLRNAKAIRKPNGEIVIETQVNDSSTEDDEPQRHANHRNGSGSKTEEANTRAINYHYGRHRATSTHCRLGMPHAFCLQYNEQMAQIVAHWIRNDQMKKTE